MKLTLPVWAFLALGALVVAATVAGGWWLYTQWPAKPEPIAVSPGQRLGKLPTFLQSRQPGKTTEVAALGRLAPRGEVIDIGGVTGDRLDRLEVTEGQRV